MTWTVTKESGAVSFSDWLADEAAALDAEKLALVQAFRSHPPVSLKLTFRGRPDPFESELAGPDIAAPIGLALFAGQSRSIWEDLLNRLPMMILAIDADGALRGANLATAEVLGYAPEELVGRKALSLLTEPSCRDFYADALPRFCATGRLANVDVQLLTKNGETADFRLTAVGEKNAEGRIERSIAVFADIRDPQPAR
jgi:PAS domain S-box-containing protein